MDGLKEIYGALAKAQAKFEAALKGSQNPQFRSKYAALDACVDAVRAPLNEQGIFLTQPVKSVEGGVIVETIFCHSSGEVFRSGELFVPVSKHDAQGYGSALTYARRYSLLAACGVAPEDDDANAAVGRPTQKAPKPFDVNAVMARISNCKTVAEIQLAWGENSMAAQEAGNGAYAALKQACKDKKDNLQPQEVAA